MTGADDIFRAMQSPQVQHEAAEARQLNFEEWVVKAILRFAGVQLNLRKAQEDANNTYGHTTLGLKWFADSFPSYPVKLATSKLRGTSGTRIGWTSLFGASFAKLPWLQEYQKAATTYGWQPTDERCALVFNAPKADKSTVMVLHNQPLQGRIVEDPERNCEPETRIIRPFGKPKIVYVIESLHSFMQTVGNQWAAHLWQPPS